MRCIQGSLVTGRGGREGGRGTYLRSVAGMGVMKARAGVARARKEMVRIFR